MVPSQSTVEGQEERRPISKYKHDLAGYLIWAISEGARNEGATGSSLACWTASSPSAARARRPRIFDVKQISASIELGMATEQKEGLRD